MNTSPTAVATPPKSDFADWINPMLVKELRQSLRTKVFLITFISLHVLMMVSLILGLIVASKTGDATVSTVTFWMMISIPLIYIIPMRGLGAISGEMKANTLEPVFLTRLTSFRIVSGKWLSMVGQTALLVCSVLPYAFLRYFLGGVNIADELGSLGWLFLGSCVLSAVTTGSSPYQTPLTRALCVFGIIFFSQIALSGLGALMFSRGSMGGSSSSPLEYWVFAATLLSFAGLAIVLMLETAATRIAPLAENHSASMRLCGAGFFLVAIVHTFLIPKSEYMLFASLVPVLVVILIALSESPRDIPGPYRAFLGRGPLIGLAGRFLYPGWPSALLYTFLAALCYSLAVVFNDTFDFDDMKNWIIWISLWGAVLWPFVFIRLILPKTAKPLLWFIGLQFAAFLFTILFIAADQSTDSSARVALSICPTCVFFLGLFQQLDMEGFHIIILSVVSAVTVGSFLLLFLLSVPVWRKTIAPLLRLPKH